LAESSNQSSALRLNREPRNSRRSPCSCIGFRSCFGVRPIFLQRGPRMTSQGLSVRAPNLLHMSRPPGVLEIIAPFLKSNMWESQELAMVIHKSYELMKKHVGYIRTLSWTASYTSKPLNFMMSEAISLILKLLPPVRSILPSVQDANSLENWRFAIDENSRLLASMVCQCPGR